MLQISAVVPVFNEEESLSELTQWISRVMNEHGFSYEIILVMTEVQMTPGLK